MSQNPILSQRFKTRTPSSTRQAQIKFEMRSDDVKAINVAIGNVPLPMHPAMQKRMDNLRAPGSPFTSGCVEYTTSAGFQETQNAFLNIIESSGFSTDGLYTQITDGGSQGMELILLGVCGPAGSDEKPLLMIDAAYSNYLSFAGRVGRKTVSVQRNLQDDGTFTLPDVEEIERKIKDTNPGAMLVIPYDNPTGHYYDKESLVTLAKLCVKYNLWMISDEAYRELYYGKKEITSIWGLTNNDVPGIEGRRISIETASKVWNACGLRIGALITDNEEFHRKSVAEYTANLCANAIGQYIFGSLAHESHEDLVNWYNHQRDYYKPMMTEIRNSVVEKLPGVIFSMPQSALYSVIDVRNIAKDGFDADEFVEYCASKGKVEYEGEYYTLLCAPLTGFYTVPEGQPNPGRTQMRIAYVIKPEKMMLLPHLFVTLFKEFEENR